MGKVDEERFFDIDRSQWMAYIYREVEAACTSKGWVHQTRRSWSVRERPVSDSPVEDYEWKLIPDAGGQLPDASSYDGTYFVLSFDSQRGKFVLQHSTSHVGIHSPDHERSTYSEIHPDFQVFGNSDSISSGSPPPEGWLKNHLIDLTARFEPNHFCIT